MLRVSLHGTAAHQISLAGDGRAARLSTLGAAFSGPLRLLGLDLLLRFAPDTPALLVVCSAGSTELSLLSTLIRADETWGLALGCRMRTGVTEHLERLSKKGGHHDKRKS